MTWWKNWMLVALITGAGIAAAALAVQAQDHPQQDSKMRRVESITLDPTECKLRWTVSTGKIEAGKYVPKALQQEYEIDFHSAEMQHDGVTFKFSEEEAVNVHQVMLAISRYAAESVEWFEQQKGPSNRAATPGDDAGVKQAKNESAGRGKARGLFP